MILNGLAKSMILIGMVLIVIGALLTMTGKLPGVGKLPGDIVFKKENFSFYFPVTTCILLSVIISLFMFLLGKK